jgi:hypothetical protein
MMANMRLRHTRAAGVILVVLALTAACGKGAGPSSPAAEVDPSYVGHHSTATIPPPKPLRDGERFEAVNLARAYQPKPPHGGTDEYRCFLVDPHIATQTYLTGSQFLPDNNDIVHHAIVYRVDPANVAQAKALDDKDPGDGWTCFGGTGVRASNGGGLADINNSAGWIGAWAPGASETLFDAKVGYPLAPGSQLVLQIHYNLLETNGKAGPTDKSGVRLRLHDAGPGTMTPLSTVLVAAPIELPCAPTEQGPLCDRTAALNDLSARFGFEAAATVRGLSLICGGGSIVAGPTQHCDQRVTNDALIYSVAGHMHLLGRSIKVELNPGTPNAKVLLDLPQFNFDDQAQRPMATPVAIHTGDTLRVTCTHDATLRTMLPELKPLQPRYVMWGDGTSDEMCLGILAVTKVV